MKVLQPTGATQSTEPRLAVSWAALEMPYPVGTVDRLAVSWAALEIQGGGTTAQPTGPPGVWALKFEDTFEGTSLDTTRWTALSGNNLNNITADPAYVAVHDGNLWVSTNGTGKGGYVSSASRDGAGANHYELPVGGVAEARVFFPGNGATEDIYNWPAWWTAGDNWPSNGEHDIAEGLGGGLAIVYHYGAPGSDNQTRPGDPSGLWGNAWHTFTLHRKATTADVYYDGVKKATYTTSDSGGSHSLLFTVGQPSEGSSRTAVTGQAGSMRVDWVRAWEPMS